MSGNEEKAEKYDRQIRLWGAHGQQLIEKASVACLNINAATTETLKNLVLPGIGSYTIVDHRNVENSDLGCNFFVTIDSIGKSKAQVCCELLQELNSDVRGNYLNEDPCCIIDENISWFDQFAAVLVTNLPTPSLLKLANYLYPKNIPLIIITSVGFLGSIRVQIKEHSVVESKPDNSLDDLRINQPWPELQEYCEGIDLKELDDESHAHIPYVVLLYQTLQEWKKAHDNNLPSTYKEKNEFKALLMKGRRSDIEGNYDEGFKEAKNAWLKPELSDTIRNLFESDKCNQENSSEFWLCVSALKQFYDEYKVLPVSGVLPDMSADTISYQAIQSLYKSKAEKDLETMTQYLSNIVKVNGSGAKPSPEYVALFCKNANFICSVATRSIAEEYEKKTDNGDLINAAIDDDMYGTPKWYLALRGYYYFIDNYNRAPGSIDAELEQDALILKKYCDEICKQIGISTTVSEESVQELCRFGGGEIHTTSATLGGIVAQEIIKLITFQLVPLDSTLILDGMNCTTAMFRI